MRILGDSAEPQIDADVAIVGYGPVGQALAALLGRAGHRVAVFERFTDIYRLPRAVHLDHEIMRLLQSLGLADTLAEEMIPVHDYHCYGADGKLLLRFDMEGSLTRSAASIAVTGDGADVLAGRRPLSEHRGEHLAARAANRSLTPWSGGSAKLTALGQPRRTELDD